MDLTLLSIAIVFPLVFSIRGSFRRREKALQHFSRFRSALKTLSYYISSTSGLQQEQKDHMFVLLQNISDETMKHLASNEECTQVVDSAINGLHEYLQELGGEAPTKLKDRVFKFLNRLHEGFENLHAINTHRTPVSLKAYCLIFIYAFPLIYAPNILMNIGATHPDIVIFFIVLLTQFILITLYNIQDQLEYPFDDDGLDDIKLQNFKFDR
ncbi:hypothetical protein [Robiginitalea sp. SC105]|uniref:hypothetical protein n=1 Tax=Robiginitalea sp. SC105 TaxID=2762332 RepID=UPI00351C1B8B